MEPLGRTLGNPFYEWDWLAALEDSGCVDSETGWTPNHLTVWREERLIGLAPLYLKDHSRGEFVFDHEWAEVSRRLNIAYYPKLLGMSPFTPARGYQFFIQSDFDKEEVCSAMIEEIERYCRENSIAGYHFLHVDAEWREIMVALGVNDWLHHALVWENQGFQSFEDYLSMFKSKRRNKIRRERKGWTEQGVFFRIIPGAEAPPFYFELMYHLYAWTCAKFYNWSHYLNQDFFKILGAQCGQRLLFVAAYDQAQPEAPIAMSFLVQKGETLHGRYWGCREHYEHLHFEVCYYQPIAWAIANGIKFFDAGSGNARHKCSRGFPAIPNYSLHRLLNPIMAELWDLNIDAINALEQRRINGINQA